MPEGKNGPGGVRLVRNQGGARHHIPGSALKSGFQRKRLCFGSFKRNLAEFFHGFFDFEGSFTSTCAGSLVAIFELSFGFFLECFVK